MSARKPAYEGRVCSRYYLRWLKQEAWYCFVMGLTKAKGRI